MTHCIGDSGVLFFNYKYLHNFEAKSKKVSAIDLCQTDKHQQIKKIHLIGISLLIVLHTFNYCIHYQHRLSQRGNHFNMDSVFSEMISHVHVNHLLSWLCLSQPGNLCTVHRLPDASVTMIFLLGWGCQDWKLGVWHQGPGSSNPHCWSSCCCSRSVFLKRLKVGSVT